MIISSSFSKFSGFQIESFISPGLSESRVNPGVTRLGYLAPGIRRFFCSSAVDLSTALQLVFLCVLVSESFKALFITFLSEKIYIILTIQNAEELCSTGSVQTSTSDWF